MVWVGTINMPISTEGSGMPPTRPKSRKEGDFFLFNDALNTFYLRLYGVRDNGKGPFRQ